jgi:hypothetical protein
MDKFVAIFQVILTVFRFLGVHVEGVLGSLDSSAKRTLEALTKMAL